MLAASSERVRVTRLALLGGFCNLGADDRALYGQFATMVRTRTVPDGVASARFLSETFRASHREVERMVDGWIGKLDPEALAMELDAVTTATDLRPRLQHLRVPTMVRVGDLDVATPVAVCRELAGAIVSATLEIVPGAGHLLLLEDFPATLASVRRALRP